MTIREKWREMSVFRKIAAVFIAVIALLVLVWIADWLVYRLTHVTSDAGFVKADMVEISPLVPGHVKEVLVDEGAQIKAGQPLVTLDDRDYQQAFERADAAFTKTSLNYDRQRKLHLSRVIADAKFEEAEASYKEAKAAREIALLNIGHTRLIAPFDGVVAKKYTEPGDFAAPGLPVVAVYDPASLHVMVNLEESKVGNVAVGKKADLFFDARSGKLQGVVVRIGEATAAEFALIPRDVSAGEFTKVVQRVPVKISLPDRSKYPFLKPGLSVSIGVKKG